MKLNRTGAIWDRMERNKINENWDRIEGATIGAGNALDNSIEALDKAKEALSNSESTQEQLDNIIIESGTSVAEVVQARTDEKGVTHTTLKKRIDNSLEEVTSQLNETESNIKRFNNYKTVGYLRPPEDFPRKIPFSIYKDINGKITHDFNFSQYNTNFKIYVNNLIGNDANDGLSVDSPVRNLTRVFQLANESNNDVIEVVFLEKWVSDDIIQLSVFNTNKKIKFSSYHEGGSFFVTNERIQGGRQWTKDGQVYKTVRKRTELVADYKFKDVFGYPISYKKALSLSDLRDSPGSFYQNGDDLFVNRLDGSMPDEDVAPILAYFADFHININGGHLVFDNVHVWRNTRNDAGFTSGLKVVGSEKSRLVLNKSSIRYARFNGLTMENVSECFIFDTLSSYNGYDGTNYHGDGSELVVEVNCYVPYNGDVHGGTGNGTSAHDGMSIFRAGVVGHDCYGPVLADVNGCYSVNYDCVMYNSLRQPKDTKAAFYFDDSGASKPGKTYLIDCEGGGVDTFSINSDGAEINVRNFKGANIPKGLSLNILD